MFSRSSVFSARNKSDWLFVPEAVRALNEITDLNIMDYDIYHHALLGRIKLSILFPSPVCLRKIKYLDDKIKFTPTGNSTVSRLCMLDSGCFLAGRNLVMSTEGRFITSLKGLIDTSFIGHESTWLHYLLARSLRLQQPFRRRGNINYGITATLSGETFQVFECMTWRERINRQLLKLPRDVQTAIRRRLSEAKINEHRKDYFPLHRLPADTWIVIRYSELEKLVQVSRGENKVQPATPRMSSPLARLFWLACRNNDTISPLINQPYKMLPIFEQWAANEGITDKLSGDTLKAALKRGSPPTVKIKDH
ncbi:hypothetical protein [Citrobacter amalonaticus]|uniref:hypothetical protein n=1 Tax=Citrobacter amalonaticus TaxID=35703 RepID=UPI001A30C370|nr:hypothetical protein [Citrobacter amalonaticus]HDQ2811385.1 hypothetical protein [Citrobacter amalonaticus]